MSTCPPAAPWPSRTGTPPCRCPWTWTAGRGASKSTTCARWPSTTSRTTRPSGQSLAGDLAASDYVIVASRRVYGSIPRLPERYPLATRYYELLFAGDLGFELAGEFTRGPAWLNPRLPPLPGAAPAWLRPDESFVVYDHPRALIFRNVERLPAAEILQRLSDRSPFHAPRWFDKRPQLAYNVGVGVPGRRGDRASACIPNGGGSTHGQDIC